MLLWGLLFKCCSLAERDLTRTSSDPIGLSCLWWERLGTPSFKKQLRYSLSRLVAWTLSSIVDVVIVRARMLRPRAASVVSHRAGPPTDYSLWTSFGPPKACSGAPLEPPLDRLWTAHGKVITSGDRPPRAQLLIC